MTKQDIKAFNINTSQAKTFGSIALILFLLYSSLYTVDANENGVVLRFGKYVDTTLPGLHFKLPIVDSVYKVKVDYQHKEEFGFRTIRSGVKTQYSNRNYERESWMLTGDLKIADVKWVVQYNIKDPVAYLFNIKNITSTVRDVSESVMRTKIGDRSFHEVLQAERIAINDEAKITMQEMLDRYESGIRIQMVQLQGVVPPEPVADSFNEVNRAKQEEETLVNDARREYNKKIYNIMGTAEKIINEAEGYAVERINNATGDAELFNSVLKEYKKAPKITRKRLFLEKMEKIMSGVGEKVIVDPNLEGILPLLNLDARDVD
tara:strand:- start:407 stop:1366 length:960 start_codon:yes stop_codon:yes gene_type:complete